MRYVKLFVVLVLFFALCDSKTGVFDGGLVPKIPSKKVDFKLFFPQSSSAMVKLVHDAKRLVREGVKKVVDLNGVRTFENTILPIDRIGGRMTSVASILKFVMFVHPDKKMRESAQKGFVAVKKMLADGIYTNRNLYRVVKTYATDGSDLQNLSEEQRYYLDEMVKFFELRGLALPENRLKKVRKIAGTLMQFETTFEANITHQRQYPVVKSMLDGLDQDLVASLPRDAAGFCLLPLDKQNYRVVKTYCTVPETREKIWVAYNNRAYPENEKILERIISLRDEYARLIGFFSYAHFNLASQMAQTPEKVTNFLDDISAYSAPTCRHEMARIKSRLPVGVNITADGLLEPWDISYIFKGDHVRSNSQKISDYFPAERTIEKILLFFENFLKIKFDRERIDGLWADEIECFRVSDVTGALLGHLFLDLYPRPGKYTRACKMTLLPVIGGVDNSPGVAAIIANFPSKKSDRYRCLELRNVSTLFHEMGHVVHMLLSKTTLTNFFSADTRTDFVEIISQLFEELAYEPKILKKISGHCQTGEPLNDKIIEKLSKHKKNYAGRAVEQLIGHSRLCLTCYDHGVQKDLDAITRAMHNRYSQDIFYDDRVHFLCSFGHIARPKYGPAYYSYLWSQVIACDIYNEIKRHDFNEDIGQKLVDRILRYGRGSDPEKLLHDFLGRAPNSEAFVRRMGF